MGKKELLRSKMCKKSYELTKNENELDDALAFRCRAISEQTISKYIGDMSLNTVLNNASTRMFAFLHPLNATINIIQDDCDEAAKASIHSHYRRSAF